MAVAAGAALVFVERHLDVPREAPHYTRCMDRPRHLDSAGAAADAIIAAVGDDIVLGLPLGLGKANRIANALFRRAAADAGIRLRIFTALTLEPPSPSNEFERRFLEPVVERLFDGWLEPAYAAAIRDGTLPPNIQVNEFFFMAGAWLKQRAATSRSITRTRWTCCSPKAST